jgi:hypothetical protein
MYFKLVNISRSKMWDLQCSPMSERSQVVRRFSSGDRPTTAFDYIETGSWLSVIWCFCACNKQEHGVALLITVPPIKYYVSFSMAVPRLAMSHAQELNSAWGTEKLFFCELSRGSDKVARSKCREHVKQGCQVLRSRPRAEREKNQLSASLKL